VVVSNRRHFHISLPLSTLEIIGLTALIQVVSSVLSTGVRRADMKFLAVLVIFGLLYTYAVVAAKSFLDAPTCEFFFTRRGCGLLSKMDDSY
jgi:hypothetical protein